MYRASPCLAIICILYLLGATDGKTTTSTIKAPTKTPVPTKKPTPNLQSLPNRTNIITTRFGADGVTPAQQCQCTLFYLCNTENTVVPPGESCAENYVCCSIIENLSTVDPPLPGDINNGGNSGGNNGNGGSTGGFNNGGNGGNTGGFGNGGSTGGLNNGGNGGNTGGVGSGGSSGNIDSGSNTGDIGNGGNTGGFSTGGNNGGSGGFNNGGINGGSTNGGSTGGGGITQPNRPSTNRNCTCVPPNQCNRDPDEAASGANDIDIKLGCSIYETCCPVNNIINPGGGGVTEIPPIGVSDTPVVAPQCGGRNGGTTTRIVSPDQSRETSFGEFPWMALLLMTEISPTGERIDNVFVCGASLLSPTIVLTAAHCLNGVGIDTLKVRVGEYDTHLEAVREPKPHQDRAIVQVVQHHNFHPKALYNDLALLEVSEPFQLDTHISPICIPPLNTEFTETNNYDPTRCVATGWGKNSFGQESSYPLILKKVDLAVVPNDQCQQQLRGTRLGQAFILDPSFMCAGGQPGMDTCEGDGGGPLVCALRNDPNRYVQVGIVAWGIGCGNEIPSVYASLEANLDWLSVQFNRLIVGVASRFGNTAVNGKPGNSTITSKPNSTGKPGTTVKSGTTSKPGTTVKPGTTSKPGTTVKPGTTSKPTNTTKSGKALKQS